MSKQKLHLAENPKFFRFIEQDFPVVKEKICDTDFMKVKVNCAYDLKNRLNNLLGGNFIPSKGEKMHCYGSLQREKLMWE